MDAPSELLGFVAERPSVEEASDACPSLEWFFWLAGAASAPLAAMVHVLGDLVERRVDGLTDGGKPLTHALQVARDCVARRATREQCEDAARSAEFAANELPATFRTVPGHGYAELARAAMWTARGAEGVMTARLRLEARRLEEAHRRASWLGGGIDIALSRSEDVALDAQQIATDAFHADLLYVIAACAEGGKELSLAHEGGDNDLVAEARTALTRRLA